MGSFNIEWPRTDYERFRALLPPTRSSRNMRTITGMRSRDGPLPSGRPTPPTAKSGGENCGCSQCCQSDRCRFRDGGLKRNPEIPLETLEVAFVEQDVARREILSGHHRVPKP